MSNLHSKKSFLLQFLILTGVCLLYYLTISEKEHFSYLLLIILFISWLLSSWITHKYNLKYYQNKWLHIIAPFIKSAFILIGIYYLLSNAFLNPAEEKNLLYNILFIYIIVEVSSYSILIFVKRNNEKNNRISIKEIRIYEQENLKLEILEMPGLNLLKINDSAKLFTASILKDLCISEGTIGGKNLYDPLIFRSTKNELHFEKSISHCILDFRINDINDINKYLNTVYNQLLPGGYLFAAYEALEDFEFRFLKSDKNIIRFFKNIFYYLYFRAFPKFPILNRLYHIISLGKNKVISKAELWGRLSYSGFEVMKQINISGISYVLARKTKTPSANPSPSFFPIITLNRVSMYGQIIKIHKIRSMYPYSEFLQEKVYEEGNISSTGKFENDFRITKFGKIFRKYWIDELPQIIDWLRGEIKLVGIRAMSQHYFSLYPDEYKKLYFQVKPGIVSPIFDENTNGFNDIVKIEQKYLKNYLNSAFITDFKYFFITLKHIFKGIKSS